MAVLPIFYAEGAALKYLNSLGERLVGKRFSKMTYFVSNIQSISKNIDTYEHL